MTSASASDSDRVGQVLDTRYRLDAAIGAGAMATVYRAFDQELGRTVAVKVFRPGTTDAGDERRRDSEKRLLASLSHPSLVTLFDARVSQPENAYLVMEYIDGGTLTDRLDLGVISSADAASLAVDLGEALHVVHAAGIIHRDIKPSNILLRPPLTPDHTFRAVLADFGIAYLVDTARVTTPGMAVGTAAYISPEQVRGAEPTPASDIYSLGLVLIEALTGRRAFPQQNSGEAIAARLSTPPQIPSTLGYTWRSTLARMTAVDPSARPTAIEVAAAARGLDAEATEPDATVAATQVAPVSAVTEASAVAAVAIVSGAAAAPGTAGADAPPPTAPTRLLPESRDGGAADASLGAPDADAPRPARRRLAAVIAALAAAAVIAVVAVVWSSTAGSPSPAPSVSAEPTAEPVPSATPSEAVVQPAATTPPATPVAPVETDGGAGNENSGPGNNNGNGGSGNSGSGNNGNGKGKGK